MAKENKPLKLREIYGHQFANKEMMDNYRAGWERIFGKKEKSDEIISE